MFSAFAASPFLRARASRIHFKQFCPLSSGSVRQPLFIYESRAGNLFASPRQDSGSRWSLDTGKATPLAKKGLAEQVRFLRVACCSRRHSRSRLVLDDLDLVLELVLEFHVSRVGSVDHHLQVAMHDIIATLASRTKQEITDNDIM